MAQSKSFFRHGMAKWFAFVMLLFVIWFAGWFGFAHWANGKLGDVLTTMRDRGISVECVNRDIRGFPFRAGIHCEKLSVDDAIHDFRVSSGTVRSAAQLYAPTKNIIEVDGPFSFENPAIDLSANWEQMRIYADVARGGFDLVSTNYRALDGTANGQSLTSDNGVIHSRPRPVAEGEVSRGDLDLAATLNEITFGAAEDAPFDVTFDATVDGAYRHFIVAQKSIQDWMRTGREITIRTLLLSMGDGGALALEGPITINPDMTLSGKVRIGLANPDAIAAWATAVNPELGPTILALGQGIQFAGKENTIAGGKMRTLDLTLNNGVAKLGFIELGRIPSLDQL